MVGMAFFLDGLVQQRRMLGFTQNLRPAADRSVGSDFIMLHALRRGDQRNISHGHVCRVLDQVFSLCHQRCQYFALDWIGLLDFVIQDLLQPRSVNARFLEVGLKRLFQLNVRRFLNHRRQSFDDLIFRGKQHPQLVTIKAPQGLKIGREKFHLYCSFFGMCWWLESTRVDSTRNLYRHYSTHLDHWAFPAPAGLLRVSLWTYLFKF